MAPAALITEEIYNWNTKSIFTLHSEDHGKPQAKVGALTPRDMVIKAMREKTAQINPTVCLPGEEDAFYVADLGEVYRQHLRWKMNLPNIKPFFAVKSNPDVQVLRLMANLGSGFDCASKAEMEQVLDLGVDPGRIIYAQPCKTISYIRYAAQKGVKQMTFDNADELHKIKAVFPEAELVLRILTDDSASLCRLSAKFGASRKNVEGLLSLAKDLDLQVIGVSFHVGSGASDPCSFVKAVEDARNVFDDAATMGFNLRLLDVGGGFEDETFEVFAGVLAGALREHFPSNVRIIAEPGRYYVAKAFTLATNIIARRDVLDEPTEERVYMLYLNDGAYGNFSNIIFDHQHPVAQVLRSSDAGDNPVQYSIWGPTCDGIDMITERCTLPGVLGVGDWLFFENMGAYTKCSATRFNGFTDDHEVIYISSEVGATALLQH